MPTTKADVDVVSDSDRVMCSATTSSHRLAVLAALLVACGQAPPPAPPPPTPASYRYALELAIEGFYLNGVPVLLDGESIGTFPEITLPSARHLSDAGTRLALRVETDTCHGAEIVLAPSIDRAEEDRRRASGGVVAFPVGTVVPATPHRRVLLYVDNWDGTEPVRVSVGTLAWDVEAGLFSPRTIEVGACESGSALSIDGAPAGTLPPSEPVLVVDVRGDGCYRLESYAYGDARPEFRPRTVRSSGHFAIIPPIDYLYRDPDPLAFISPGERATRTVLREAHCGGH